MYVYKNTQAGAVAYIILTIAKTKIHLIVVDCNLLLVKGLRTGQIIPVIQFSTVRAPVEFSSFKKSQPEFTDFVIPKNLLTPSPSTNPSHRHYSSRGVHGNPIVIY